MIVITIQRDKCIGCNYCVEVAPDQFQMSKKYGKTVLLHSDNNKGFHTLKLSSHEFYEVLNQAEKVCPVKIIKVKTI